MSQAEEMNNTPLSRAEACLKNCVEGLGTEGLPQPMSRSERYLHILAEKMAGGITSSGNEAVEAIEVDRIIMDPSIHEGLTLEITERDGSETCTAYYVGDFVIPSLEAAKESTFRNGTTRYFGYQYAVEYDVSGHKAFVLEPGMPLVVSTPVDNLTLTLKYGECTFPKRGLYLIQRSYYQEVLRYTGPVIKTKTLSKTPDWSDITNKPFGDETITEIEWDGEIGDRITVYYPASNITYVLVSELNIPKKDVKYAHVVLDGRQVYVGDIDSQHFINSYTSGISGITFPKKGIYFPKYNSADRRTKKIVLQEPVIVNTNPLDARFIPKTAVYWDDIPDRPFYHKVGGGYSFTTIEWDGVVGDKVFAEMPEHPYIPAGAGFVHISDSVLPSKEFMGPSYVIGVVQMGEYTETSESPDTFEDFVGIVMDKNYSFISVPEDNMTLNAPNIMFDGTVFTKKGLYALYMPDVVYTSKVTGVFYGTTSELKKIDEKFLPEPLAYEKSETVTEETTIEWDGVIGDRDSVLALNMDGAEVHYVRVSDCVFPADLQFGNVSGRVTDMDGDWDITQDSINGMAVDGPGYSARLAGLLVSVSDDNTAAEFSVLDSSIIVSATFPKKGLYFCQMIISGTPYRYPSKLSMNLTLTKTEIKKIDPKFLPEPLAGEGELIESIEWDNNPDGKYSVTIDGTPYTHFSDITFADPVTELIGSHLVLRHSTMADSNFDGILDGTNQGVIQLPDTNLHIISMALMLIPEDNCLVSMGEEAVTFEKKGIYVMGPLWESIKLTFAKPIGEIKKLDPKFLPDTIAPKELILTSSTEGSTKRFKITVTDDGTVTATEVV